MYYIEFQIIKTANIVKYKIVDLFEYCNFDINFVFTSLDLKKVMNLINLLLFSRRAKLPTISTNLFLEKVALLEMPPFSKVTGKPCQL